MKRKMLPTLAALVVLVGTQSAKAAIETFDFSVTATFGPLTGASASGSFGFDSSIVPAGGGVVGATGLLTNLAFTWNGISYTAATANTGQLTFDATGALVGAVFGNNCFPLGCETGFPSGVEEWAVEWLVKSDFFTEDASLFFYVVANTVGVYLGTSSLTPVSAVPEPTSLALFVAGLLGLGSVRRRKTG